MKTIKVKIYNYAELNEEAKQKAAQWFVEGNVTDAFWWEKEDAKQIGLLLETCDIYHRDITGRFVTEAETCARSIVKEHGESCETFQTATNYLKELEALGTVPDLVIPHTNEEENAFDDKCEEYDSNKEAIDEAFLKDILQAYLSIFRKGLDYEESAEYIRELMESNGYTFTKDGKRFG